MREEKKKVQMQLSEYTIKINKLQGEKTQNSSTDIFQSRHSYNLLNIALFSLENINPKETKQKHHKLVLSSNNYYRMMKKEKNPQTDRLK